MRRVELTHDVLCSVVIASRDKAHEREAREQAERQLAEQRAREEAQHRALLRARMVAAVCAVLMVVAAASAVFGWVNLGRARAADTEAQKSRALAEKARGDAEKLVAFLIDDFYTELEPTGQLDTLGRLAHTAVSYYDGLPKELVTPQTETFRAMAMVREAAALNARGQVDTAYKILGEAQAAFEKLHAADKDNEAVAYGLALSLYQQGQSVTFNGRGTAAQLIQAADLLRPLVQKPDSSRQVRQAYADTLNILSHTQPKEIGVATCQEARKILEGLGALDLSNLNAASAYADTGDSEARHLMALGRIDEAQKLEMQVYDLTEKVLVQRPSDLRALADRFFAAGLLGDLAERRHDDGAAADYANRAAKAGEDYVRFNPADLTTWSWWITGLEQIADSQFDRGEMTNMLTTMRQTMALADDKRIPSSLGPILWSRWLKVAAIQAMLSRRQGCRCSSHAAGVRTVDIKEQAATLAAEDPRRQILATAEQGLRSRIQLNEGDPQAALANASAVISHIEQIKPSAPTPNFERSKESNLRWNLTTAATAALRLGHGVQAEPLARQLAAIPSDQNSNVNSRQLSARASIILAHAVALQERADEARTVLQPTYDYYQSELKAGAHGTGFRRDYAYALYVSALTRPADAEGRAKREAELAEAAKQIAGVSAEAAKLSYVRELAEQIATARAAHG